MSEINKKIPNQEDLNVFQAFDALLQNKILIISFIILGLVMGLLINSLQTVSYTGTAKVRSITDTQVIPLRVLGEEIEKFRTYRSTFIDKKDTAPLDYAFTLDARNLFDLFVLKIISVEMIAKHIDTMNIIDRKKLNNEFDYSKSVYDLANSIKIENFIVAAMGSGNFELIVSFKHNNPDIISSLIDKIISDAIDETKADLIQTVHYIINDFEREIKAEIENLNQRNEIMLIHQRKLDQDRILVLKEQLEIAKNVGITQPLELNIQTSSTIQTTDTAGFTKVISTKLPDFYTGTLALEKELELLQNRTDQKIGAHNIVDVRENEKQINFLKQKILADDFKNKQSQSSQIINSLNPVFYESSRIIITTEKIRLIHLIIAGIILGLMFGVIISIFKYSYSRQNTN